MFNLKCKNMKNINEIGTVDELFNVVKFNDFAKSLSLAVYDEFRKGWNKVVVENEKTMCLFLNEVNTFMLVRGVLKGVPNQTINNIIEKEGLESEFELVMRIVTMFFYGDVNFSKFQFRLEECICVYENPTYTEKDGYNNINETFENLIDWKELWLEFLSQNNMSKDEYPLEEYAKDNGYIPLGEYKELFLY